MDLWQYNAWCEAYQDKIIDTLSIQIQAAYLGAYWGGFSHHKKSLQSVLNSLRSKKTKNIKNTKKEPINVPKISEQFRQMEELKLYGYTKE